MQRGMNRGVLDSIALGILIVGLLFAALALGYPVYQTTSRADRRFVGFVSTGDSYRPSLAWIVGADVSAAPLPNAPASDPLGVRPAEIAAALVQHSIERRRSRDTREQPAASEPPERDGARSTTRIAGLLMVPEPGTAAQLGLGLVLLAVAGRRRL